MSNTAVSANAAWGYAADTEWGLSANAAWGYAADTESGPSANAAWGYAAAAGRSAGTGCV
jgi:hypothetical protein